MFSVNSNNHKWTELAKELKWSGTRRIKSARAKLTWLLDSRASFSTFYSLGSLFVCLIESLQWVVIRTSNSWVEKRGYLRLNWCCYSAGLYRLFKTNKTIIISNLLTLIKWGLHFILSAKLLEVESMFELVQVPPKPKWKLWLSSWCYSTNLLKSFELCCLCFPRQITFHLMQQK